MEERVVAISLQLFLIVMRMATSDGMSQIQ
jgi:hypothetical protein